MEESDNESIDALGFVADIDKQVSDQLIVIVPKYKQDTFNDVKKSSSTPSRCLQLTSWISNLLAGQLKDNICV